MAIALLPKHRPSADGGAGETFVEGARAVEATSDVLKKVWRWTVSAVAVVGAVIVVLVARASKRRKARPSTGD